MPLLKTSDRLESAERFYQEPFTLDDYVLLGQLLASERDPSAYSSTIDEMGTRLDEETKHKRKHVW